MALAEHDYHDAGGERNVLHDSPLHGFQGDRGAAPVRPALPASLTIALSREAGARGGSIARRVGGKLGWQVYTQELLEYLSQEPSFRQEVIDAGMAAGVRWAEERLDKLLREQVLSQHPSVANMARVILTLSAQGEIVLVGRGAGYYLPRETTLHVRVVAPLADRIAYMSQLLRLTVEEATEQVTLRDTRRAEFIAAHFHHRPGDVYQYDLVLNSRLLGEELCTDLIIQAARAKLGQLGGTE